MSAFSGLILVLGVVCGCLVVSLIEFVDCWLCWVLFLVELVLMFVCVDGCCLFWGVGLVFYECAGLAKFELNYGKSIVSFVVCFV